MPPQDSKSGRLAATRRACSGVANPAHSGQKVVAFEIWKLRQQVVNRVPGSKVFEHRLDGVAQAANDRLAVADLGIDGDARQQ